MRPWIIRPMTFTDTYQSAFVASRAYHDTKFTEFLSPHRRQYPADYICGFQQRITSRLLCPNNRSWVAVAEDEPNVPVAYMQCERLGDDEGAKQIINERKSVWRSMKKFLYDTWVTISNKIWPDRSTMDAADLAIFFKSQGMEEDKHWNSHPERSNRWYCRSMVVSQEWQRRGIGRVMMNNLVALADDQNVPIQLEASPEGEWLYRSVGFQLLDRFMVAFGEVEKNQGGVMIYNPKKKDEAPQAEGSATAEETSGEALKKDLEIEPTILEVPVASQ